MYIAAVVSVQTTADFIESDGTVQVCAGLTGTSQIPICVTVSATDGKDFLNWGGVEANARYTCLPVVNKIVRAQQVHFGNQRLISEPFFDPPITS